MEGSSGDRLFFVSPARRFGVPTVFLLVASVLCYMFFTSADIFLFRMAVLLPVLSACMFFYFNSIRLTVGNRGISLSWPMQRELFLSWDSIIRVRKGGVPHGNGFYIDLIASPSESIQFNPFMFDHPQEIVALLEKHLGASFKDDDSSSSHEPLHGEVFVTEAESPLSNGMNRTLLYVLAVILILLMFLYFSA